MKNSADNSWNWWVKKRSHRTQRSVEPRRGCGLFEVCICCLGAPSTTHYRNNLITNYWTPQSDLLTHWFERPCAFFSPPLTFTFSFFRLSLHRPCSHLSVLTCCLLSWTGSFSFKYSCRAASGAGSSFSCLLLEARSFFLPPSSLSCLMMPFASLFPVRQIKKNSNAVKL